MAVISPKALPGRNDPFARSFFAIAGRWTIRIAERNSTKSAKRVVLREIKDYFSVILGIFGFFVRNLFPGAAIAEMKSVIFFMQG
ncbi:hypothetical protein D7M11_24640 [Paenibacillus ginsengarvi]|uniref:Uncharacterized protein n=1 Tax=Paenibacillus ginsengarvi TaxID=400777 RepID=A0A3B0BT11_9BACL|nr:hypothetical protein D7M11_24640 [Paenibacillus ginsengarvi]